MITLLLVISLATEGGFPAGATLEELQPYEGARILSIDVESGGKAKPEAVLRQFALGVGDVFDAKIWLADVQKTLNLGMVKRMATEVVESDEEGVHLRLHVKPAFPILPIFNYQTGSVRILLLGAFNANVAGELIEVGGYYIRRDIHNLFRLWLVLPNVVTRGSVLELRLVMSGNTMELYPGELEEAGSLSEHYDAETYPWRIPQAGYEILRRGFYVDYGQEILSRRLTLSCRYLLFRETVLELPNTRTVVDRQNRDLSPLGYEREDWDESWLSLLSANVILGQVDIISGYRFRGHDLRLVGVLSSRALGSGRDYVQGYAAWRGFFWLGRRWDLAAGAAFGASSSDHPADLFTLGGDNLDPFIHYNKFLGLMNIRGFRATHLHGTRIGFANLEARFTPFFEVPVWLLGGMTVQTAAFVDAGHAFEQGLDLARLRESGGLSAGGGVLLTFLDLPYTYLNWYLARRLHPDPGWTANILLMRPMF